MRKGLHMHFLRFAIVALSLFTFSNANAHRYWHSSWGWGFGAGLIGGAVIAGPYARPYYAPYPPPVVYQQPVIVQSAPIAYQTPPVVPAKPSVWYFCESENNFYPNVGSCPEPWKMIQTDPSSAYVAPNPPPMSSAR